MDLEKNTDGTWYVNSCELWLGITLLPENMLPYTAEFKAPYPERYSISKGDWISVTVGKTLRNYSPDCTLYENFSRQDINCVIEPTNGVMSPERDNLPQTYNSLKDIPSETLHAELLKRGYNPTSQRENQTSAEIIKIS